MIADYGYYTTTFCGDLDEASFRRAAVTAEAYLRQVTMGRCDLPDLPEKVAQAVKLAACALCDHMAAEQQVQAATAAGITHESNDGVSVTYASRTAQQQIKQRYAVASSYLAWTGLLYRGMGASACDC